jgi:hypothetical protein
MIVDGEAYFEAAAAAMEKAERSILLLAWDFDSRTFLEYDENGNLAFVETPAECHVWRDGRDTAHWVRYLDRFERRNGGAWLIAKRLVDEARKRQVIVFTHDLPFLNQVISHAEAEGVEFQAHWIDRSSDGTPGQVTLNDAPATSKAYDTADRTKGFLAEAQKCTGTARHDAIVKGMGALRRTIEETIVKRLFKGVVPRWSDRVIVTGLRKVAWDNTLVDEMVDMYEELSAYIEGHSHTDEAMGAPPEIKDLEQALSCVEELIRRARPERSQTKQGVVTPSAATTGRS